MGERDLDRVGQLSTIGAADAASTTVLSVEGLDQTGIVPVLDVVAGTVVDFDFDRVFMIIDQEDDDPQLAPPPAPLVERSRRRSWR